MFTTEPSLAQRIARMIGDTPIVDPRSRIRPERPQVADLAELLAYPAVHDQLLAVGMPATTLDPARPVADRVRDALPYLGRMRNTAAAWCFYRILRDLYDVYEPNLTAENVGDVIDRVAATAADPAWPAVVLDKCNIRAVVTTAPPADGPLGDRLRFARDLAPLLLEGLPENGRARAYFDRLATFLGGRPASADDLERLIRANLDAAPADASPASDLGLVRIGSLMGEDSDRSYVDGLIAEAARGEDLGVGPECSVAAFAVRIVLDWHRERSTTVMLTVDDFGSYGETIAEAADNHPTTRIAIFLDNDVTGKKIETIEAVAATKPNLIVAGDPSGGLVPASIEAAMTRRVLAVPMTKFGAFVGDAPNVEWTYGKFQVAKKSVSSSLARLVEAGYYEEHEIPPILKAVFGGPTIESR